MKIDLKKIYGKLSFDDNQVCPITNLNKIPRKTRSGTIIYPLFHQSIYDNFYKILGCEYDSKKHNHKFMFTCYIDSLYKNLISYENMNINYLEKMWPHYSHLHYEYYLRFTDNDELKAKEMLKNRQGTTNKNKWIEKYGEEEGNKKYQSHFNNIHEICSGENHWLKKLNITFKEHLQFIYNITEEEASQYFSIPGRWRKKGMPEEEIKSRLQKMWAARPKYSLEKIENYRKQLKNYWGNLSIEEKYKFGCWRACYNYAIKNNIEYTDKNRVKIWNIIFNKYTVNFWLNKGHSKEESIKLANDERIKDTRGISAISINFFDEIKKQITENIECEVNIDHFCCDGVIEDKKIIIEFFGDYWHGNPLKFKKDYVIKNRTCEELWEYDRKRIEYLTNLGYKVIIIWEHDWRTNKLEVLKKLKMEIIKD